VGQRGRESAVGLSTLRSLAGIPNSYEYKGFPDDPAAAVSYRRAPVMWSLRRIVLIAALVSVKLTKKWPLT